MKKIICIGGATIDYKLKSIHTLKPASSNPAASFQSFGGVAHNVAANLSRLASAVHFQCLVGDDAEGKDLLTDLKNRQINIDNCLQLPDHNTARYYAVLNPEGELHIALVDMKIYDHIPADLFIQNWGADFTDNIIFIDTNLSTEIMAHAIQLQATPYLCIDAVSITKAAKLPENMAGVFLLKTDRHEAGALTNLPMTCRTDYLAAANKLLERGVKNILITLGEEGYVLANQTTAEHYPAFPLKNIIDVSGAGDAFVAGILAGLQNEMPLSQSCRLGAAAAYYTLQSNKTVANTFSFSDLQQLSSTH